MGVLSQRPLAASRSLLRDSAFSLINPGKPGVKTRVNHIKLSIVLES